MKLFRVLALFLALFLTFPPATPLPPSPSPAASPSSSPNVTGITSLVSRLFGSRLPSPFLFSISNVSTFGNNTYNGKSIQTLHAFELASIQGNLIISIRGSDLISLAAGLNYYLKYYCQLQVRSWTETDTDSDVDVIYTYPSPLPIIPSTNVTIRTAYEWNYYMNVCTSSYTQVWWTWSRWSRELDWMALNGINMALAFTGQEKVVLKLYQDRFPNQIDYHNLTDFFGGPAFLAWARMGNIQGSWAGPLPLSWIEAQHTLQLQILDRMDELGITPVLPAFNGFVPRAVAALYPNSKIHQTQQWSRFTPPYCCDLLLDPLDSLFQEIGELYIRTQNILYGKSRTHLYNADTFNENRPPSNDTTFLRNSSKAVYESMRAGDPEAVWIMQAWLFVDEEFWQQAQISALLSGVPDDGMILLDMEADAKPFWNKTNHFYRKRFIWNMLHNFGGNVGLGGRMSTIVKDPIETFHNENNRMIGVGMTPEGIHQNYIVYELMAEVFWNSEKPINVSLWIQNYTTRRYGVSSSLASSTWIDLTRPSSVYDAPATQHGVLKSYMELRPNLNMQHDGFMGTIRWYPTTDVIHAVHNMLTMAFSSPQVILYDSYRFDLVDLMRQALSDHFQSIHDALTHAYETNDVAKAIQCGIDALHLYQDMDRLLSSDRHFLLGRWIAAARNSSVGATDVTPEYYEYNARNQITLWGPYGEISDYAAKQWSGLMSSFYAPRYALWIRTIIHMISTHSELDYDAFTKQSIELAQTFQHDHTTFPTTPQTDPILIVTELYSKYFSTVPLVSKY